MLAFKFTVAKFEELCYTVFILIHNKSADKNSAQKPYKKVKTFQVFA